MINLPQHVSLLKLDFVVVPAFRDSLLLRQLVCGIIWSGQLVVL